MVGAVFAAPARTEAKVHLPVPYMAQPDNQTCFPTSFMMALNYYGRIDSFTSDTIQHLHKYCQYNRFNAPEIARQYGLYALPNWHNLGWTPETVKHELDMGHPVILGVNQGRSGHFVLGIGYTDDNHVIIHDPGGNGANVVKEWKDLLWRGGVILRPEPFPEPPALSGVAVGDDGFPLESTRNLHLTSGDDAEASFTLVNNGRQKWPEKLFLVPVDPDSSPTKALQSSMANGWLAADLVAPVPALDPGTTTTINFKVTAPDTAKTTTVLQYFNLRDDQGNWFGNHWLAGPGHRNMGVRMIVMPGDLPEVKLPLKETMAGDNPALPWETKFGAVKLADKDTTAAPGGLPIAHLLTWGQTYESAWVGSPNWADYKVEAWVYCDLRPELNDIGFERVGIFARDNGQHRGDTKTELEIGYSIVMTFDSDDGSIRAGDVYNGTVGDFRNKRHKIKESGWHHFSVAMKGQTVTYELDYKPFHVEPRVRAHTKGDCGVYYNSSWKDEPAGEDNTRGIYFSDFKASEF